MDVITFLTRDVMEDSWQLWTEDAIMLASFLAIKLEKYAYFRSHFRSVVSQKYLMKSWLGLDECKELSENTKRLLTLSSNYDNKVNTAGQIYDQFIYLLKRLMTSFLPNHTMIEPPFPETYTISYLARITNIDFEHARAILQQIRKVIEMKEKYPKWHIPELFAEVASTGSLDQYDIECFKDYFGRHSNITFYIRMSLLVAFNLKRIIDNYNSVENWCEVKNIVECQDCLRESIVILFLCTYQ